MCPCCPSPAQWSESQPLAAPEGRQEVLRGRHRGIFSECSSLKIKHLTFGVVSAFEFRNRGPPLVGCAHTYERGTVRRAVIGELGAGALGLVRVDLSARRREEKQTPSGWRLCYCFIQQLAPELPPFPKHSGASTVAGGKVAGLASGLNPWPGLREVEM